MNIHDLSLRTRFAIWYHTTLGNGHFGGTHLWIPPNPEPPAMLREAAPVWSTRWRPPRFSWHPYGGRRDQWLLPLCGRRSRAQRVLYTPASRYNTRCQQCTIAARDLGLQALYGEEAEIQNRDWVAMRAEEAEWIAAGSPRVWPPDGETP